MALRICGRAEQLLLGADKSKCVCQAFDDSSNVPELSVAAKTAAVGSRIAAGRALAVRVLNVFPDALFTETVLARCASGVCEKVEAYRALCLEY